MELLSLRYFAEVARLSNLTKAASNLNISQSAVSRQIRLLEEELGVQLFKRSSKGLFLTSAGKEFYENAENILRQCENAVRKAQNREYVINEPLSIAFMDDTFSEEIYMAVKSFKAENPTISISFYNAVRKNIRDLLKRNEIDVAFIYYYKKPEIKDYLFTGITNQIGIIMSSEDELAKKEFIDKDIIRSIPLIVPLTEIINPDRNTDLPYDPADSNIVAQTSNPLTFTEMALQKEAYIFTIRPELNILNHLQLTFRPVYPILEANMYIIKAKHPQHKESTAAFMKFAEKFFRQKTETEDQ